MADLIDALVAGFTTGASQVLGAIGSIVPVLVPIVVAFAVVFVAVRLFRRFAK
jgi:phage-related protein